MRKSRLVAVIVAVLLFVGAGGTLVAEASSSFGTTSAKVVYGCINLTTRQLERVFLSPGHACPTGSFAVSWNEQGRTGPAGPVGPPGQIGPEGPAGQNGTNGTNGTNGSSVLTGTTVPSGSCTTGDSYVDLMYTASDPRGEVWNCASGTWVDSGNSIQGPQGPQGIQGIQGIQGVTGKTGPSGVDGTSGTNGSSVLTGNTAPSGSCTTGDSYIDLTATATPSRPAGEVWNCTSGTWVDSGNSIQGPQGVQGKTGPTGPMAPSVTGVISSGTCSPAIGTTVYSSRLSGSSCQVSFPSSMITGNGGFVVTATIFTAGGSLIGTPLLVQVVGYTPGQAVLDNFSLEVFNPAGTSVTTTPGYGIDFAVYPAT